MNCPHCKQPLVLMPASPRSYERVPDTDRRYTTTRPIPAGALGITANARIPDHWQEITVSEPVRQASKESDVVVPLFQALITGALLGFGALVLGVALSVRNGWPWWYGPVAGLVMFVLVATAKWNGLLNDSRDLLRKIETVIARDLDGDNYIGKPPAPTEPASAAPGKLRLEVNHSNTNGTGRTIFADLPCDETTFTQWVQAAIAGRSLAYDAWVGSGKPFSSRSHYIQFTDEVERAGIIHRRASNMAYELTRPGKAMLTNYLTGGRYVD